MMRSLDWTGRPRRTYGIGLILSIFLLFGLLEMFLGDQPHIEAHDSVVQVK